MSVRRRLVPLLAGSPAVALLAVAMVAASGVHAQEPATLSGVVVDDYTGAPVADAVIALSGRTNRAVTDASGWFLLDQLPVGTHELRFEAPGYASVVEELELSEAEFLQVRLTPLTAVLDEILVIAGRPRRTDDPPGRPIAIDGEPWRSVLNLLEDQVPGVVVRRRGALGAGAAIFIRGFGTFQGNASPDVYLDGVRIDSAANPDALHVLDQIRADEVARIRVYKGASAGAALGSANGTIVIETHRGSSARRDRR
jgi:hypothetical protein